MVADEVRPLLLGGQLRPAGERLDERRRVVPGEREVEPLHGLEVELQRQLLGVAVAAEVVELLLVREVDLAEQDRLARTSLEVAAEVAHELVRIADLLAVGRLDEERHGVDAEPGDAELQPEPDGLRDLVAHHRVRDVEVGLVLVERVQVVLAGRLVPLPDTLLLAGEDALGRVRRHLVAPDVVVAVGRVPAALGRREPRMPLRGVVHDEVHDDPHPAVPCGADDCDHVAEGAEPGVDVVEVGDVVAVVEVGRRLERHEPDARDAELGEVVEPLREPVEVAAAVVVPVHEGLDVEAVDDGGLPPEVPAVGGAHDQPTAPAPTPAFDSSGSTCSPNASMNPRCSWPTWCR